MRDAAQVRRGQLEAAPALVFSRRSGKAVEETTSEAGGGITHLDAKADRGFRGWFSATRQARLKDWESPEKDGALDPSRQYLDKGIFSHLARATWYQVGTGFDWQLGKMPGKALSRW